MGYRPLPSVIAVLAFSINTGLVASTTTPGSTAPELSFTTPASVVCAQALAGATHNKASNPNAFSSGARIRFTSMSHQERPLTKQGPEAAGLPPLDLGSAKLPPGS